MNHYVIAGRSLAMLLGVVLLTTGCTQADYGDLGRVSGTVTLDGKPYPNAEVTFSPEAGGRPSKGITDESGHYELIYIRTTKGAELGTHAVRITTIPKEESAPGQAQNATYKEPLPTRYNTRSDLMREVAPGDTTIDFDLQSK